MPWPFSGRCGRTLIAPVTGPVFLSPQTASLSKSLHLVGPHAPFALHRQRSPLLPLPPSPFSWLPPSRRPPSRSEPPPPKPQRGPPFDRLPRRTPRLLATQGLFAPIDDRGARCPIVIIRCRVARRSLLLASRYAPVSNATSRPRPPPIAARHHPCLATAS